MRWTVSPPATTVAPQTPGAQRGRGPLSGKRGSVSFKTRNPPGGNSGTDSRQARGTPNLGGSAWPVNVSVVRVSVDEGTTRGLARSQAGVKRSTTFLITWLLPLPDGRPSHPSVAQR